MLTFFPLSHLETQDRITYVLIESEWHGNSIFGHGDEWVCSTCWNCALYKSITYIPLHSVCGNRNQSFDEEKRRGRRRRDEADEEHISAVNPIDSSLGPLNVFCTYALRDLHINYIKETYDASVSGERRGMDRSKPRRRSRDIRLNSCASMCWLLVSFHYTQTENTQIHQVPQYSQILPYFHCNLISMNSWHSILAILTVVKPLCVCPRWANCCRYRWSINVVFTVVSAFPKWPKHYYEICSCS